MSARAYDAIVLGGDPDGLTAAIGLAEAGAKVRLLEAAPEVGGVCREIEFAPGFRAAPLAPDLGYVAPEVLRAAGQESWSGIDPDPAVIAVGDGVRLPLFRSAERTASELHRLSAPDARAWVDFTRRVHRFCGFLAELYRQPPPRVDGHTLEDWLQLASLGRRFRSLGREEMAELLRTIPMSAADWLDDWFESEPLKGVLAALAVTDLSQGPVSGGTALAFLHRHVGAPPGVIGARSMPRNGPGVLVQALQQRAVRAGVEIETGAAIRRLIVRDDRIAGVSLASGEELPCRMVISSLDPRRSLLELLDIRYLDPDLIHAIRNIRYRGVTMKILLALDGLPESASGLASAGAIVIAPSVRYVEQAYDAAKYGRCSDQPFVALHFPSVARPELAPAGRHVAVLHVQYTPYRLRSSGEAGAGEGDWETTRDRVADRSIAVVEHHLPGFMERIRERCILAPPDLEARFGLREGAISQGEMTLDQWLFMRPLPGWARYAMPVAGLYLCGPGTHPGPGAPGLSGCLAARVALGEWAWGRRK